MKFLWKESACRLYQCRNWFEVNLENKQLQVHVQLYMS